MNLDELTVTRLLKMSKLYQEGIHEEHQMVSKISEQIETWTRGLIEVVRKFRPEARPFPG